MQVSGVRVARKIRWTCRGERLTTDDVKSFFRWLIRLCVTMVCLVLLLAVLAVLLKDVIAKSITERNLRDDTGMDAKITKMEIGLATPTVNIEGLKLYNSADFGGGTFLEMPELRVEYIPEQVRTGKMRFKTVRLNLSEVHIVKNKSGKTNLELMQKQSRNSGKDGGTLPGIDFAGIDTLYLTVGQIRLTDESNPKNNEVINLGVKEEVGKNLNSEEDVTRWLSGVLLKIALRDAASGTKASHERWQKLIKFFGVRF